MAGPLRGGGDILLKMTYQNIHIQVYLLKCVVGQQSPCPLTGLLKYLPRSVALLVQ